MKVTAIILFLLMSLSLFSQGQSKKLGVLNELAKPGMIAVFNDRAYITEGTTIYIYSLKDCHLIKKFGKNGEGPQEFSISPFGPPLIVMPFQDKLYISSHAKMSLYSKDGEFIKETKVMPFQVYQPFGNMYVSTGTTTTTKKDPLLCLNLCNEKFEKIKELYVTDMKVGPNASFEFPITSFAFVPYKDKIYIVAGKEGFVIDVFDNKGTKSYRIKKEYKELPLPEEYKQKTLEAMKNSPQFKPYWEYFKNRVTFKNQYPAIQFIDINEDKLFVQTYKRDKGNQECIIMDLKGKVLKTVFLPIPIAYGMDFEPKYSYFQGAFFQILENEEEETWELFKTELLK